MLANTKIFFFSFYGSKNSNTLIYIMLSDKAVIGNIISMFSRILNIPYFIWYIACLMNYFSL